MATNDPYLHWKSLCRNICKLIKDKKINITSNKERLIELMEYYFMNYGLSENEDLLLIYHNIKSHQTSFLKLACGAIHCIECYYTFFFEKFREGQSLDCSCKLKIVPKYRSRIESEYKRLQGLKLDCTKCLNRKDKMEFAVYSVHKCNVCSECILRSYQYVKGFNNRCPQCSENYDPESEILARNTYESRIPVEDQLAFHTEQCPLCHISKDSRTFYQICQTPHMACQDCSKNLKDSQTSACELCGNAISILQFISGK